jgi:proline dehydrogenase
LVILSAYQTTFAPALASRVNPVLRRAILASTTNTGVRRVVGRYGMRFGGDRFVAGESIDEAVGVLRRLTDKGLLTNTTILGEHVRDRAATERVVSGYVDVLERLSAEGLPTNVALKLSHLGLALDEALALENLERIVAKAAELGTFVRIDMEESDRVDATLRIYRALRERGHDNVGTVLQAYLRRTPDDLAALADLAPNLRLVKGAYLEPPEVAFASKAEVDAAYARLLEQMLATCSFVAVATHDERLIEHAKELARARAVPAERLQFQMLYGVRPQLQLELVREGYSVLVATPYGPEWYPYLMRRLAERPANLLFVVRNLFRS